MVISILKLYNQSEGGQMSGPDSMVTLQERMVNLVNQLNMPVLESSMVISRWTNRLLKQLTDHSSNIPDNLAYAWPLDVDPVESNSTFDLEKALSLVDRDRMDILDTLIRVTLEEEEMLVEETSRDLKMNQLKERRVVSIRREGKPLRQ